MSNAAVERSGASVDDDIEDRLLALKGMKIAVSPAGSTGNSSAAHPRSYRCSGPGSSMGLC